MKPIFFIPFMCLLSMQIVAQTIDNSQIEKTIDAIFKPLHRDESPGVAVTVLQNGKIIIGGSDNNDGKINYKIIRYHSNGSLDNDFKMGEGFNNIINSIAVQSDGRIILGGKFTSFNQIPRNYVARVFGDVDFSTKSMVFPNPTKDILNINNGNFNQAHVYDMSGRLVKTVSIINRQINLSELSIGYYFVQLQENNNKETFKIVKQ